MAKCGSKGRGTCSASPPLPLPALVFGVLFTLILIVYLYFAVVHRKWRDWLMILAVFMTAVGYYTKYATPLGDSRRQYEKDQRFIAFNYLLFLAIFPLNAYLYTLPRDLYRTYIARDSWKASPAAYICICVLCELIAIALQTVGLNVMRQTDYAYDRINHQPAVILFASFMIHILLYILFLYQITKFRSRYNAQREAGTLLPRTSPSGATESAHKCSRPRLILLYLTTLFLLIRVVYYAINSSTTIYFFDDNYGVDGSTSDWGYYVRDDAENKWQFKWFEPGQIGADGAMVICACLVLTFYNSLSGKVVKETGVEDTALELDLSNVEPVTQEQTPVLPLEEGRRG